MSDTQTSNPEASLAKRAASRVGGTAIEGIDTATDSAGRGLSAAAEGIRGTSEAVTRRLEGAGQYLQEHDPQSIGRDITNAIRQHPKIAIGVGLGLGFLLGRMIAR